MDELNEQALANVLRRHAASENGSPRRFDIPAPSIEIPAPVIENKIYVPEQEVPDMAPFAHAVEAALKKMTDCFEKLSGKIDALTEGLQSLRIEMPEIQMPEIKLPAAQVVIQQGKKRRRRLVNDDKGEPIGFDEEDVE